MVYVFLANGCEEIEALTPVDLLRRAELEVCTVGLGGKTIRGAHGISILCDMDDAEISLEGMEMVVLPGGMPGTLNLEKSPVIQRLVDYAAQREIWVAAICAAPSILGHKGLLRGRKAVCYPGYEEQLEGARIAQDAVCVDGHFVTARSVGVAIPFALKLVELLTSGERAAKLKDSLVCGG